MKDFSDDAGGGGICNITPQDQQGQLDNLISRVERLESTVEQLASADTTANQLSDFTQSGGWLYDVTYLGQKGWTQTAAGTLIPPAGVSLSSLGLLPSSTQLSVSSGSASGVGGLPFFIYTSPVESVTAGNSVNPMDLNTAVYESNATSLSLGSKVVTVNESGYYMSLSYVYCYTSGSPFTANGIIKFVLYLTASSSVWDNHLVDTNIANTHVFSYGARYYSGGETIKHRVYNYTSDTLSVTSKLIVLKLS